MILLLDNYDSFTYNLYQYLKEMYDDIVVIRNDQISCEELFKMKVEAIVFSPGSGHPHDAGRMEEMIASFYRQIPMLGICLGHQGIAEVFGGRIAGAKKKLHGEASRIQVVDSSPIFDGLAKSLMVGRYHSLIVESLGEELCVIAWSEEGEIMAIKHREYPIYGIQFHPESILTPCGKQIIRNFLRGAGLC